jgi:transcriptional regulator with XRE-family HTH domain
MTVAATTDVVRALERARRQRGISQTTLADMLDVTQGHYSKVVRGLVPLSGKMAERVEAWLAEHGGPIEGDDAAALRLRQLATSIRAQCMELMHLSERVIGKA